MYEISTIILVILMLSPGDDEMLALRAHVPQGLPCIVLGTSVVIPQWSPTRAEIANENEDENEHWEDKVGKYELVNQSMCPIVLLQKAKKRDRVPFGPQNEV